jgi:hypothetical protein
MKTTQFATCAALPLLVALAPVLFTGCATPPPTTVSYPAPSAKPPAPPVAAATASPPAVAVAAPVVAPAAPVQVSPSIDSAANDRAVQTAVDAYDRGDFANATRQLNTLVNEGSLETNQLLRALKTLAFSQCSTNALTACRQSFERAFKTDATFDLLTAERGHPIWGAQFLRARRTVLGK